MESSHVVHPIPALYDDSSCILILGSFPSVKSRESRFFYGHPQNRYWRGLAAITEDEVPATVDEKRAFLLRHHIAAWDVIGSCEITGSSDSSIRNAVPNDLTPILVAANIRQIFTNGKTADRMYRKYCEKQTGRNAVCLPSTSPANAAWSLDRLIDEWKRTIEPFL